MTKGETVLFEKSISSSDYPIKFNFTEPGAYKITAVAYLDGNAVDEKERTIIVAYGLKMPRLEIDLGLVPLGILAVAVVMILVR